MVPCDRCGQDASRVDVATRTAIAIDLDHPAVLAVRVDERYEEVAPLRRARARAQMTPERFVPLSQFLRHPAWEATHNGAERAGPGGAFGIDKGRTSTCAVSRRSKAR